MDEQRIQTAQRWEEKASLLQEQATNIQEEKKGLSAQVEEWLNQVDSHYELGSSCEKDLQSLLRGMLEGYKGNLGMPQLVDALVSKRIGVVDEEDEFVREARRVLQLADSISVILNRIASLRTQMVWMVEMAGFPGYRTLGMNLQAMREQAGLKQAELGERLGLSNTQISHLENYRRERRPTIELVYRWAEECGFRVVLRFEPVMAGTP